MTGTQKDAYNLLLSIAQDVKDGEYGEDDNFDDEYFEDEIAALFGID